MTTAPLSSPPRPALRLPVLVALGAALWFLAAMMIRFLGPSVFVQGSAALPLVFVLSLPVAWAFLWVGLTLSGARGAAVLPAVVVMSFTAMLLDGLALTFFPALYGLPPASLLLAAAWLLWGVALTQVIAFVWPRRAQ
ncbi:DUF5367 family protein [Deinococcus planocerae]|uniref:DUF5367 family protein n=1 Tax=Deinococcus planocerae TaxID=1737569 RepID=UPI000C7F199B|nr:DUF5367 family protein [Deinococcus planocerae]